MKPKILITDKIHPVAIKEATAFAEVEEFYGHSPEEIVEKIPGYEALIVRSGTRVTRGLIEASDLKIIGRAGVGLDNIDLKATEEKGIRVVNSPEASTIAVAELVIGSMITLFRRIHHADRSMREGKWERDRFIGNELYGKILGIVGFGRIGKEVGIRARAFGMDILVHDPNITAEDAKEFNAEYAELDELLRRSDIVTLHIPLTEDTRNLIDEREIGLMKNSAVILNIARGGIINESVLYNALKENRINGAVLDVFEKEPPGENPLKDLENVVLLPHLGASTNEAQINAGTVVVEKIRNFFRED